MPPASPRNYKPIPPAPRGPQARGTYELRIRKEGRTFFLYFGPQAFPNLASHYRVLLADQRYLLLVPGSHGIKPYQRRRNESPSLRLPAFSLLPPRPSFPPTTLPYVTHLDGGIEVDLQPALLALKALKRGQS